jgi:lantibiotic modifying enzyme
LRRWRLFTFERAALCDPPGDCFKRPGESFPQQRLPCNGTAVGAFSGLGGIIYALSHLGVLWKDGLLIDRAKALAAHVPALVEADNALDVIGGSAGAIAALEVLNGISSSDHLLNAATVCGERLLSRQRPHCSGAAWKTDSDSSQPLTGFSHGAAGIAWALLKLAAWSGDAHFRESAELAIAYERSTFEAEEANWPDYRPAPDEDQSDPWSMVAWCHGAPGIGLARIDSLRYTDDLETRQDVGYGLLRVAYPVRVPSVLVLAPPARTEPYAIC